MWTATLNFILSLSLLSPCLDAGPVLENFKLERTILNRTLPIRKLSRFDHREQQWREQSVDIRPGQIVLLHLWAVECKPCLAELKTLTPLLNGLRDDRRLNILFITETQDRQVLANFFRTNLAALPTVPQYQIDPTELRRALGTSAMPITLLLDADLTIRQTFLGPLHGRREELLDAIDRLEALRPLARRDRPRVRL